MNKEEYLKELNEEIRSLKNQDLDSTGKEHFLEIVRQLLVDGNALPEFDSCVDEIRGKAIRGGERAYHVDGYHIPEETASVVHLIIVDWSDEDTIVKLTNSDIEKSFELLSSFYLRSVQINFANSLANPEAQNAAKRIAQNNASNTVCRVRLVLVTNKLASGKKLHDENEIDGLIYENIIIDLERLRRFAEGERGQSSIDISFEEIYGSGLSCILAQDSKKTEAPFDVYLGVLPGDVLADIYRTFGQRLMESNVRAYLQGKGKVNRGIVKTAKDEPSFFIAYNNGICCTASKVSCTKSQGELLITGVKNLQIVNGGQSTASLFFASQEQKASKTNKISEVKVQFKLIVLKDNKAGENDEFQDQIDDIVHSVSRYSNSQNKISEVDLASNTAFHRKIEEISRRMTSGINMSRWYYERARGSYLTDFNRNVTKRTRDDFKSLYPLSQKFDKTTLARVENIWRLEPFTVSKGSQGSFQALMKFFGRNPPLVDELYFKHLVAKIIVYNATEAAFREAGIRGQIAAPACYFMAWVLKKCQHRLNLDQIWDNQKVGDGYSSLLKSIIPNAHDNLMAQIGDSNPLSVFSRPAFWLEFSNNTLMINQNFEKELLSQPPEQLFVFERSRLEALWDEVRINFINSDQSIKNIELEVDKEWMAKKVDKNIFIKDFAVLSWADFCQIKGLSDNQRLRLIDILKLYLEK